MSVCILIEEIPEPGGSMFSRPEKIFHGYTESIEKADEWKETMEKHFKKEKDQVFFYITIETSLEEEDFTNYQPENYIKLYMKGLVIK
ncbi:MAG: hypothetical protein KAS78_03370 [Candidatus Pacebacteria bacterium]|nr:hypothetical protein [Candidatus Paceibacterota bacterium]